MTAPLKTALALSLGIHAGLFIGWPATSPAAFDVERAATSVEIHLVASRVPREAPRIAPEHPTARLEPMPDPLIKTVREPDPVPQTVTTVESQGALGEVLPGYVRNRAPVYPLLARQRGEEGLVVLEVQVLPTGRCGAVSLRAPSGSRLLDEAAVKAVRQWQFKPAQRAGHAVAVRVQIPIRFELLEDGA